MRYRNSDVCVAGMWKDSTLTDICWFCYSTAPRPKTAAPTWSWASVTSPVSWELGKSHIVFPGVEVLDLEFTLVGPAHIGEVKDASVTIKGPVFETKIGRVLKSGTAREPIGKKKSVKLTNIERKFEDGTF